MLTYSNPILILIRARVHVLERQAQIVKETGWAWTGDDFWATEFAQAILAGLVIDLAAEKENQFQNGNLIMVYDERSIESLT